MKRSKTIYLMLSFFLLLLITNCKEELVVESKKENSQTSQSILAKENVSLSMVSDSLTKKEKIAKLKKEHEKPYVVIHKPEKLLAEYLKSRTSSKSLSKLSSSKSTYSAQSTQSCSIIEVDVWALEKYHSISGFNVGILPKNTWQYNSSKLTSLKNTWAFNLVQLERMAFANPIVYPDNQIVAGVAFQSPKVVLDSYRGFLSEPGRQQLYGFYGDEPWHAILAGLRDSISKTINDLKNIGGFTTSKYIGGETCEGWAHNFDDLVDFVNQTAYTDMTYTPGYGCYRGPWDEADQRDEWTDFNNSFGGKFDHVWVSGELDRGEMDQLIGHAQNMCKTSIWLYAGQSYIPDQSYWDAISEFSYYAFMHGYLRREERRFIYIWSYIGYGDPCTDPQITSWELTDIIETNETRIR